MVKVKNMDTSTVLNNGLAQPSSSATNVVDLEAARLKRDYVGKQCWSCSKVIETVGPGCACPACGQPLEPF